MNKVICDVCGTDYPDTAGQCPICGCARAGGAKASAGDSGQSAEYTYVKGGRFSKSNVRKRLKNGAVQATVVRQTRPNPEPEDNEEEEYEGGSNRGLIAIVIILLLAIIAVSAYIIVTFVGDDESEATQPSSQTQPSTPSTQVPCTGLKLLDASGASLYPEITLSGVGSTEKLNVAVEPADTTDAIRFTSMDTSVVTVDTQGNVIAVGSGETTVVIRCGTVQISCAVKCEASTVPTDPEPTDPEPTDPEHPTEPETPDEPDEPDYVLKLNREEFSLSFVGDKWQLCNDKDARSQITWTSSNPEVATVEDGLVVAVSKGNVTITATYGDQKATCKVYCQIKDTEPEEPEDPTVVLELNREDFTLSFVGDKWQLYSGELDPSQITWTSSNPAVATVENGLVVAVSKGSVTITATYGDQTATCKVYCTF